MGEELWMGEEGVPILYILDGGGHITRGFQGWQHCMVGAYCMAEVCVARTGIVCQCGVY